MIAYIWYTHILQSIYLRLVSVEFCYTNLIFQFWGISLLCGKLLCTAATIFQYILISCLLILQYALLLTFMVLREGSMLFEQLRQGFQRGTFPLPGRRTIDLCTQGRSKYHIIVLLGCLLYFDFLIAIWGMPNFGACGMLMAGYHHLVQIVVSACVKN